ncbi:MAG: chemotaxis protein CheD, partial [Kofleriaceae bacterium]|nr:chemotaxis protein CheD [Kofleriaceae bacterium]
DLLQTTLGSCIGISFLWRQKSVFGLAHCLLPLSPEASCSIGAKYVDQAVESLIRLMRIAPENFAEIEVHIAGGGDMFPDLSNKRARGIGSKNAASVRKQLSLRGIKIKKISTGGTCGRRMLLDCQEATVAIRDIGNGTK